MDGRARPLYKNPLTPIGYRHIPTKGATVTIAVRKAQRITISREDAETLRRLIRYVSTTDPEIQNLAIHYDHAIEQALNHRTQ